MPSSIRAQFRRIGTGYMKPDRLISNYIEMAGRTIRLSETERVSPSPLLTPRTNQLRPTRNELLVADIVTKHDITVNQKLTGRCNFCFRAASPAANLGIGVSSLFVAASPGSLTGYRTTSSGLSTAVASTSVSSLPVVYPCL